MNARQHLNDLALSDTGFVFDPYSGATFTANPAALCALQALKEGLGREEFAARARERFAVPPESDPAHDLDEFILLLRQHGLVPADFSLAEGA